MAHGKKSFILYLDQVGIFNKLSDEQAGVLIKHIYSYVADENPVADFVTELAFESIKQALKRDLVRFEDVKLKRSEAGRISAEKRKQQKLTKPTSVKCVEQTSTNPTVSVNDNDNVNDNVSVNDIKESRFDEFWNLYPKKVGKETAKKAFKKLKESEIDLIFSTINNFIKYKPFTDYTHPNPSTYINNKRWQDEIPTVAVQDRPDIDKRVAHVALQIPSELNNLIEKGWTKEEIQQIASA